MTGRALITGAGDRLGREMALHLGARGWAVAVHYNSSAAGAERTACDIAEAGGRAVTLAADLLDEAAAQDLLPQAEEALGGPIALLINNASIFEDDSIETGTRESWDRHMESNLRAPVVLTQHLAARAPEPARDGRGEPLASALVINMIDQRVRKLTPAFMSYTIAKMGLWAFTRTAAQALAPRIRVNAIGPGPTLQGTRQSAEHFQKQRDATILERGANVDDITAALQYFIDAKGVTGQLLCIDGGQHLAWKTPDVLGPE